MLTLSFQVSRAQDLDTALYFWYPSPDLNGSGQYELGDIIHLVNYLFKGGVRPAPTPLAADLDCSGTISSRDLVLHVNWLFRNQWQFLCYGGYLYRDSTGEREAERLAMLLSGELAAPDSLKARVRADLSFIRSRYGDSHPGTTAVPFVIPWRAGTFLLRPDSMTLAAIQSGSYTAWDSLNAEFQFTHYTPLLTWLWMWVNTTANMSAVARLYQQLPGMVSAFPDHWGGDWPTIWPQQVGDTIKYVFFMGWDDCPAGCASRQYTFYKTTSDSVWPVGFWNEYLGAPTPAWWPEALSVWQNYRQL